MKVGLCEILNPCIFELPSALCHVGQPAWHFLYLIPEELNYDKIKLYNQLFRYRVMLLLNLFSDCLGVRRTGSFVLI